MRTKVIIDRFEGDKAVLVIKTSEETFTLSRSLLPADAKEGDILLISLSINRKETENAREEIAKIIKKLSVREKNAK